MSYLISCQYPLINYPLPLTTNQASGLPSMPTDPYPIPPTDQEMYNIKQHIRNNVLQKSKVNLFLIKIFFHELHQPKRLLTDCGTYPQLPTQPKKIVQVQTNTVVFYGHPELSGEEKSKFEFEEKKFSID